MKASAKASSDALAPTASEKIKAKVIDKTGNAALVAYRAGIVAKRSFIPPAVADDAALLGTWSIVLIDDATPAYKELVFEATPVILEPQKATQQHKHVMHDSALNLCTHPNLQVELHGHSESLGIVFFVSDLTLCRFASCRS